jgi:hypothetical protein
VIAIAGSGRRFAKLARYLEYGADGKSYGRIEWAIARNLIVDDPAMAARVMQTTAAANHRVTHPVYHVAVAFHPDDVVTRETMERVADRLLRELGLAEHQVLIVAHSDRPHAHMHLMINRIHPETGKAWDRWQDRVTTQRVLREEERALGLREVRGTLHQLSGQDVPERTAVTRGEHRTRERTGEAPLLEQLRPRLPHYRAATTWAELETRLAADGFRFERKGQGLVITDGEREVKASRVARDFSFARLQERLGPYPERAIPQRTTADAAAQAASQIKAAERANELDRAIARAAHDADAAKKYLDAITWAQGRATASGAGLDRALARLYERPDDARELLDHAVKAVGRDAAARDLAERPRAYGSLRQHERSVLGVLRVAEDRRGHARAVEAAHAARQAVLAAEQLRARVLRMPPGMARPAEQQVDAYVHALSHARTRLRHAEQRLSRLRGRRGVYPTTTTMLRELRAAAMALTPPEVQRAVQWLTAPQAALVHTAREVARNIALGR